MKIEIEIFEFKEKYPKHGDYILIFRKGELDAFGVVDEHDEGIFLILDDGYYEINFASDLWAYAPKLEGER